MFYARQVAAHALQLLSAQHVQLLISYQGQTAWYAVLDAINAQVYLIAKAANLATFCSQLRVGSAQLGVLLALQQLVVHYARQDIIFKIQHAFYAQLVAQHAHQEHCAQAAKLLTI